MKTENDPIRLIILARSDYNIDWLILGIRFDIREVGFTVTFGINFLERSVVIGVTSFEDHLRLTFRRRCRDNLRVAISATTNEFLNFITANRKIQSLPRVLKGIYADQCSC